MTQPGTYQQYLNGAPLEERAWSVGGKIAVMILFSSMGFFGSSCSAAITKQFGALTMSITSTARKATTLFLSFFLFNNVCTLEHIAGVVVFITALTTKSMRRRHHGNRSGRGKKSDRKTRRRRYRAKHSSSAPAGSLAFSAAVPMAEITSNTEHENTLRHRSGSHESMEALVGNRGTLVHVV